MNWGVKLQRHGGQYRITLPGELIVKAGFENVKFVNLEVLVEGRIEITGYYGKGKEKSGIQKDRS